MRIDKINQSPVLTPPVGDKVKKEVASEKASRSTDRVEIQSQPSIDSVKKQIKENIIQNQKSQISAERLEAIKQKINQGEYYIDTNELVRSIL
ncbi:MAG: hypothetical protein K0R90_929 [Oscillospiraceae bacterium]|jgi:anti-sigma28 factor (negative regulator of flagellin synthesis)|nr:hypothetical protein [Oscillospiraceae bacterium]